MSATARLSKHEPGSPSEGPFERILLASEGRPISDAAIARVVELAKASGASVRVFTIARIHGVSFGMQMPGLLPTKARVEGAARHRRQSGQAPRAQGHRRRRARRGTRKTTKRILQEAELAGCDAIVMAADPDRNRVVGDFDWSQEPQRVRRKAKKIPVFLVYEDG